MRSRSVSNGPRTVDGELLITKVRAAAGQGRCSDADDEKFFSAALAGRADFLVTKNKKHFPRDTLSPRILNVREFLRAIEIFCFRGKQQG